jgi:uncharacterized protein
MPDSGLFSQGLELFNAGKYFDAHEKWEDLWRVTEGPERTFYQGLIHAAVGLYHLGRRNTTGARSQLIKSIRRLRTHADDCCEIDNAGLIQQLELILDGKEVLSVQISRLR